VHVNSRLIVKPIFVALMLSLTGSAHTRAQLNTAPTSSSPVDQDAVHQGPWKRSIESDLIEEKFDDLDRMAEEYRRGKSRLPGGDWKLHVFYETLDAPQQTDKDSVEHLNHLQKWMKLRPESITARVALTNSLHRWAWVARGNGMADSVTPEGWKLFAERSRAADIVLEDSRDMKNMCPEWYSQMLAVGIAEGWEISRMRDIFERGIQFEPGYQYLYKQYANAILPKWYGKAGDASTFAKTSADKIGGDTGDMIYFEIASNLVRRGDGDFPVKELDWERIQRGYHVLTQLYGASRRGENQLAFMAYKYRDTAVAKQQFATIGDEWANGVWRDRKFFDRARDWASGRTSWQ
jgi:hypothetical protein